MTEIKVALRVRPTLDGEISLPKDSIFINEETGAIILKCGSSLNQFNFDHLFDESHSNDDLYKKVVWEKIPHLFEGFNLTILAYGATGSGKTYLMGTGLNEEFICNGIIHKGLEDIFNRSNEMKPDFMVSLKVSFFELFFEEIRDLLHPKNSCSLRGEGNDLKITHLSEQVVSNVEEAIQLLEKGVKNRCTESTAKNIASSRSHAFFTVIIIMTEKKTGFIKRSKFQLVDLAGSERPSTSKTEGKQFKQGININKGLTSLGRVIKSHVQKRPHIPYRDSILTRLLQDAFGGNSFTVMLACINQCESSIEETLNTIRYASEARCIKNRPTENVKETIVEKLKKQIATLELEIEQYKNATGTEGKRSSAKKICADYFALSLATAALHEKLDKAEDFKVIIAEKLTVILEEIKNQLLLSEGSFSFDKFQGSIRYLEDLHHKIDLLVSDGFIINTVSETPSSSFIASADSTPYSLSSDKEETQNINKVEKSTASEVSDGFSTISETPSSSFIASADSTPYSLLKTDILSSDEEYSQNINKVEKSTVSEMSKVMTLDPSTSHIALADSRFIIKDKICSDELSSERQANYLEEIENIQKQLDENSLKTDSLKKNKIKESSVREMVYKALVENVKDLEKERELLLEDAKNAKKSVNEEKENLNKGQGVSNKNGERIKALQLEIEKHQKNAKENKAVLQAAEEKYKGEKEKLDKENKHLKAFKVQLIKKMKEEATKNLAKQTEANKKVALMEKKHRVNTIKFTKQKSSLETKLKVLQQKVEIYKTKHLAQASKLKSIRQPISKVGLVKTQMASKEETEKLINEILAENHEIEIIKHRVDDWTAEYDLFTCQLNDLKSHAEQETTSDEGNSFISLTKQTLVDLKRAIEEQKKQIKLCERHKELNTSSAQVAKVATDYLIKKYISMEVTSSIKIQNLKELLVEKERLLESQENIAESYEQKNKDLMEEISRVKDNINSEWKSKMELALKNQDEDYKAKCEEVVKLKEMCEKRGRKRPLMRPILSSRPEMESTLLSDSSSMMENYLREDIFPTPIKDDKADPDWRATPLHKRRKTTKDEKEDSEVSVSKKRSHSGCHCPTNCHTIRCSCKKKKMECGEDCQCNHLSCSNLASGSKDVSF